jgi:ESCRT-I complex subunit VPS28
MRFSEMSPATMSMDEEVRLYTTNAERERYTLLGTLFGITVALDYLERAFVRDSITAAEYVSYSFRLFVFSTQLSRFLKEILAGVHTTDSAVQNNAEARRG